MKKLTLLALLTLYSYVCDASQPFWMNELIKDQFEVYDTRKISKQDFQIVDRLIESHDVESLVRFEIVDGKLYSNFDSLGYTIDESAYNVVRDEILSLIEKDKIKVNTSFYYFLADGIFDKIQGDQESNSNKNKVNDLIVRQYKIITKAYKMLSKLKNPPPIFVKAIDSTLPNKDRFILTLDTSLMYSWKNYELRNLDIYTQEIDQGEKAYPWNHKENKLIWRGGVTDCKNKELGNCTLKESARIKLVNLSIENPQYINARIAYQETKLFDKSENFLNYKDQAKYKYHIALDGISSTYPGYYCKLYSASLVFKQDTNNVQWFYHVLKPYVHYVPVKKDLSDLIVKIEWAKQNDDAARKIAENGKNFVENELTMQNISEFFAAQINKSAEVINFKIQKPTLKSVKYSK